MLFNRGILPVNYDVLCSIVVQLVGLARSSTTLPLGPLMFHVGCVHRCGGRCLPTSLQLW